MKNTAIMGYTSPLLTSSIKPLIEYLKINRRLEQNQQTNTKKFISVIDQKFDYENKELNNTILEIKNSEFRDTNIYQPLQDISSFGSGDHIAIKVNDTLDTPNSITYYIKRVYAADSNNPIITYKSFTNPNWVSLDDTGFILIHLNRNRYKFYYNSELNRVLFDDIETPVFTFTDVFMYDPKELRINNGQYILDYIDHKGDSKPYVPKRRVTSYYNRKGSHQRRLVNFKKEETKAKVYLFPIIKNFGAKFILEYKYVKREFSRFDIKNQPTAISLEFTYIGALLYFLNNTIFDDDFFETIESREYLSKNELSQHIINSLNPIANVSFDNAGIRQLFIDQFIHYVNKELNFYKNNLNGSLEIFYYTPKVFIKYLATETIWSVLGETLKGNITNVGLDKEDITLKILFALEEKIDNPTLFLDELLKRKMSNSISYFYRLYDKMNTSNFDKYVRFIWNVWKNTIYRDFTEENTKITSEGETLLNYKSDMTIGFHHDNATVRYLEESNKIKIDISTKVVKQVKRKIGKKDSYIPFHTTQEQTLFYDPFAPVVILEEDNPHFIFKDNENNKNAKFAILPAFVILANDQKAFWHNVIVGAEYVIDVVTTVSGVLNILKAGRLFKVLKAGHSLVGKTKNATKAITLAKSVAGSVEITSGVGNGLIKLLGLRDTPFGQSVAKYLFFLEIISLSGEISVALRTSLSKAAKEVIEHPELPKIKKQAEEVIEKANSTSNSKKSKEVIEAEETLEAVRHLDEIVTDGKKLDVNQRAKFTTEMRTVVKDGVTFRIDINGVALKYVVITRKTKDDVVRAIKTAEADILKLVQGPRGKILPENQLEYTFIFNNQKGFRTIKPVTSGHKDRVILDQALGLGNLSDDKFREFVKNLKGAIYTHNHPNFTRFSNSDIKTFLQYRLKEIRAINTEGIIYSLKLKKGTKLTRKEINKGLKELQEEKENWINTYDLNLQRKDHRELLEDFEEEFLLNTFGDKLDYRVFI